jgi:hypothetical protein
VRGGAAFDPELFTFGVQSQMGPIFHPRVLFRPNAEFAFGEVTDLIALNLEAVYRFSGTSRRGNWTPYLGAGPALIFIHQNFQSGRDIDFGNFDYETGFNILAGMQSRRGTFVELKTSLYSGPAPKLRLMVGYNFWVSIGTHCERESADWFITLVRICTSDVDATVLPQISPRPLPRSAENDLPPWAAATLAHPGDRSSAVALLCCESLPRLRFTAQTVSPSINAQTATIMGNSTGATHSKENPNFAPALA